MQATTNDRVNLIKNPSFENNITDWTGYLTTLTQNAVEFLYGTKSLKADFAGTGSVAYIGVTSLSTSKTIMAGAWVKATAGMDIFIQITGVGFSGSYRQFTATGAWQFIQTYAISTPATSGTVEIGSASGAFTAYIDGVVCEQGVSSVSYFDGGYGNGYSWSGSAGNSTSIYNSFLEKALAPFNTPSFGVLFSWLKTNDPLSQFFTIGTSAIGGPDSIKGTGGVPTFFDKYDYEPETNNVNSLSVSRAIGRIPIGTLSAQADLVLDNTSKRYLPGFDPTIGDYVKGGRPVKINIGFNDEALQQFVGYTGRPTNSLVARRTEFHAFDAMAYLDNLESALGPQTNIYAHTMIGLLLAEAGFSSSQYVLENSLQVPIGYINPYGQKIGSLIRDIIEAEMGIGFFDELGIFRFWNRLHFDINKTPVATLDYDNLTDLEFIDTPVINYVQVNAKPRKVMANQLVYRLPIAIELQPGEVRRYIINFSDDYGPLPVTSLDTPVYVDQQVTSFYKTNTQSDGSGSNNSSAITLTDFDSLGTGAVVEFTNSSTSAVMYITDLQIYGTPAKVLTEISETYRDQASIDDNGLNPENNGQPYVIENNYIQDSGTAYSWAYNLVQSFKEPRRQLTGTPFPNPAWQFGDVFSVNVEDTGQTLTMVNLGSKISMDAGKVISQRLTLEARTLRNYFTIGTSSIGGPDAIAS